MESMIWIEDKTTAHWIFGRFQASFPLKATAVTVTASHWKFYRQPSKEPSPLPIIKNVESMFSFLPRYGFNDLNRGRHDCTMNFSEDFRRVFFERPQLLTLLIPNPKRVWSVRRLNPSPESLTRPQSPPRKQSPTLSHSVIKTKTDFDRNGDLIGSDAIIAAEHYFPSKQSRGGGRG